MIERDSPCQDGNRTAGSVVSCVSEEGYAIDPMAFGGDNA